MKKLNKLVSLLLSLLIIVSVFMPSTVVYADNAQTRQATFLNWYAKSDGITLETKKLTSQDYYVLAAFMSNWYRPGETTLKDLIEPGDNGFFKDFSTAMGKTNDAQLKSVVKQIGEDTKKGINTGRCTLYDESGNIPDGFEFLKCIRDSINIDTLALKSPSRKLNFKQDGATHLAFDFGAPATRAAFQVLAAYNQSMFMEKNGIDSLDVFFVDAIGNLWGVKSADLGTKIKNSPNMNDIVDHVGTDKFYLILPACLNPSTFSGSVTNTSELKFPMMNRFVLGNLLDVTDFGGLGTDTGNNTGITFQDSYVPLYKLINQRTVGNFSRGNNFLTIFGLQTLAPFAMNSDKALDNKWSDSDRLQDIADFAYNPYLISVNKGTKDGRGKFATNSYIVVSPNIEVGKIDEGRNAGKNVDESNENIALDLSEPRWGANMIFSIYTDGDGDGVSQIETKKVETKPAEYDKDGKLVKPAEYKDVSYLSTNAVTLQQQLLAYLYTPTVLNLNQVSMSFYFSSNSGSIVGDSEDPTKEFAEYLYNDDIADDAAKSMAASTMGMKGMSLFFTYDPNYQVLDDGSGQDTYAVLIADEYRPSKFTFRLAQELQSAGSIDNVEVYKEIKGKKLDKLTGVAKTVLSDVINNSNTFSASNWGIPSSDSKADDKFWKDGDGNYHFGIRPKAMTNAGSYSSNWRDDVTLGRTLAPGNKKIFELISEQCEYIGDATLDLKIGTDSTKAENFALSMYEYVIFGPSSSVLDACETESNKQSGKLFGTDNGWDSDLKLAKFANKHLVMGTYFGYFIDMMGITACDSDGLDLGGFKSPYLPTYSNSSSGDDLSVVNEDAFNSGVINSEDLSFEEKQKDLINRIYGITNDSNNDYRNNLIKNIIEGFVLTVHRTITGTWYSNIDSVSTGSGSTYQSVTGYVYTPTLEELSFTATLMNNYIKIYIICFLIVVFMLVLMVLLNLRTWQQGMIIGFAMSIALLFPYVLISNSINISNKVSDSIYSDRFDFWAMSQHQQSVMSLKKTVSMTEKDKLLTISNATTDSTHLGDPGVKIKWMAPKKVEMFQNLYSDKTLSESFVTQMEIFKWLFSSLIYDSEFVDTDVYGSYVYRAYNNIAIEAQCYYAWGQELVKSSDYTATSSVDYNGVTYDNIPTNLNNSLTLTNPYSTGIFTAGYLRYDRDEYANTKLRYDALRVSDIKTVSQHDLYGNRSIADYVATWGLYNDGITQRFDGLSGVDGIGSNLPALDDEDAFDGKDFRNISKALYLKNTESPFYYFYSVLKTRYQGTGLFKKALLNPDIYKVTKLEEGTLNLSRDVDGKFRDFLDLEGLFTYIIPYMHESNNYVINWQKANGSEIEQYNFEYEVDEAGENTTITDSDMATNAEYIAAVNKKNSMNRVWNMYCPWVDSLYDLNIRNKKVSVAGRKEIVNDTLNPSSYIEIGRPMIFSEADMEIKGYSYGELTDVERRIQAVTENTYKDLMYLVNYYDMEEDVLLAAAAMYATFNFNKEFSQDSFLGTSVMLYPQGFELKNFNYDAFMRLALLNSTGETVFATEDLYSRVLAKTSIFTGLLLLVCDLIACIAIPMLKFIILVGLLFLGILVCIACVVNPPEKIFEAVCKSLLLPTMLFMVLNIAFSWAMSLVVGEGLTAYVGSKGINFATNDPTITMLIMAAMGCVYVFCAFKILKFLWSAYKQFGMSTALAAVGIVGAAITAGTAGIAKRATKALGKGVGAGVGMATAGKGNRLAGAFEGARTGTRGVIDRRIQEKRMARMMGGGLPSGDGKSSSSTTNKINSLAKGKGTGSGKGKDSSSSTGGNPPSELKRKLTNDTDKNATKLGRMLGGLSYAGAVVGDKARAVKSGFKKVGTVMMHPAAAGSYAKGAITEKFKSGVNKVTNYTKKSLKTYQDERAYNKFRNQERDKERMSGFNKKMATGAITHAVKKGAKAVAKRSIGM